MFLMDQFLLPDGTIICVTTERFVSFASVTLIFPIINGKAGAFGHEKIDMRRKASIEDAHNKAICYIEEGIDPYFRDCRTWAELKNWLQYIRCELEEIDELMPNRYLNTIFDA